MMMGTGSMETMSMPTTTSMAMAMSMSMMNMTSTASMDMTSTASMDMSAATTSASSTGMSMSSMKMNMVFTRDYADYPVVFATLKASTPAGAFGIFCFLFFAAFVFKGLAFLGAYVEQRVFTPTRLTDVDDDATTTSKDIEEEDKCCGPAVATTERTSMTTSKQNTTQRSVMAKFFAVTPQSLYRDFIRLIISFVSAMIGYYLMLSAMTYILPFFFAVILGMAFGDIFFLRLSNAMNIRPAGTFCASLH